jgi:NAD-dependent dihydropyrimidine dehydrogenase PreA subunit
VTFVITQPCIDTMDKSCVEVCPVDCIHYDEGTDRMLFIDPVECIDCGACQPACPVSAIFPDGDVPAEQGQFTEINALWYQDKAAARAKVAPISALAPAEGAAPAEAAPAAAAAPATPAPAPASASAPAAKSPPAQAATVKPAAEAEPGESGAFKYGEAGVEGKCAICGQYVIKGGTKFRTKSVLCPDCAKKQARIGNPYEANAGRR